MQRPPPEPSRSFQDHGILSAWRQQLAQAAPGLFQTLVIQQPELLPRFAACYTKLRHMPRRVRRGMQRRFRKVRFTRHACVQQMRPTRTQSLAGVALLLALGQAPALAAIINVDGVNCTLVDAITAANTDNAIGLCTAGSGADTLVLTAGSSHTLTTVNNSTDGPNGLPLITSAITIAGSNSTITRDNTSPNFRLLAVNSTGDLTLHGLTLTGGSGSFGGGIVNGGTLAITNSTVSGNTASKAGGGVYNAGTATLINSTISGNSGGQAGGGVGNGGTIILSNSTVSDNTASQGGGVSNNVAIVVPVEHSTDSHATAITFGGSGELIDAGTVTINNSTISGNSALTLGGGVYNALGRLTLTNSTVTQNSAVYASGGVLSGGRQGGLRSDVVLFRTLISGNTAPNGAEVFQVNHGVVTANNYNLFGHSGLTNAQALVGFILSGASDITATSNGTTPTALATIVNPALANNGGLTQTHALALGSPAIDAVTTGCPPPNKDQRGVPRPQDGNNDGAARCDIGAFERVRPGTVTCNGLPASRVGTGAAETINGTPGPDVINGLDGNDVIHGLTGNDILCGGLGNDRLFGGPGDDRLFGGAGIDRLNGELGFDLCNGDPPANGGTAASCEQLSNVP